MQRIVIIEDNEELSRMYERAFRLHGYEVLLFSDGAVAVQELNAIDPLPAAIIMDIIIPGMSGLDVLRTLRSDTRFATVPIAMLTNSFVEENEQQFLSMGADLYMVKIQHEARAIVEKIETLITKGRTSA